MWAGAARAQVDLVSPETLHGVADVRLSGADGEPSFTDGGFGKLRYGGGPGGETTLRVQLGEAAIEWTPRFSWDLSAVIDAGYQPGQEHPIDLYQAYLVFKPVPRSATRFRARAGLFYPPISLEHDARVWGVTDTITPSAIDSWVGEEVKVVGGEASLSHDFGDQSLEVTAGVFGDDDTAGTLLAFRGWALHDLKSQLNGSFGLPPLSPIAQRFQWDETYSSLEIDRRMGYYAKVSWQTPWPVRLEARYYDNVGDRLSVTDELQWAWATHFTDLGATADLGAHTHLMAQALSGATEIGPGTHPLTYVDFRAAYLLARRDFGADTVTVRGDLFDTDDEAPLPPAPLSEHGWALTGAWRHPLNRLLDVRVEAVHVESTRPSRVLAGEAAFQAQTEVQTSLRLSF